MIKILLQDRILDPPWVIIKEGVKEEDFFSFVDEDTFAELLDSRMRIESPASFEHERLFGFLHTLLRCYVEVKGLGEVLGSRFPVHLKEEGKELRIFEPDIIFVAKEKRSVYQTTIPKRSTGYGYRNSLSIYKGL